MNPIYALSVLPSSANAEFTPAQTSTEEQQNKMEKDVIVEIRIRIELN